MSDAKTTIGLARIFEAKYAEVEPFQKELNDKVNGVLKTIRAFIRKNKWYFNESQFDWAREVHYVNINTDDITPEGIYFNGNGWDDPDFLSFEDMDNIDAVLVREFEAYSVEKAEMKAIREADKRVRLEAELAELDK